MDISLNNISEYKIINQHEFNHKELDGLNYYYKGDAINIDEILRTRYGADENHFADILLNTLGNYYIIFFDREDNLYISSSLFGIMPLYYAESCNNIVISSKIVLLKNHLKSEYKVNAKFIIQNLLFNYSLFDDTIYDNIKLCPANTYIKLSKGKVILKKYFNADSLYVENPKPYKTSSDDLSDLFIERYKAYIPKAVSYISFTGGFDGRTLISCAKYHKQEYKAFSFGIKGNSDIDVPFENSVKLNIPFESLYLNDSDYVRKYFMDTGSELINITSGNSNLLYVHFLHSAKYISGKAQYMFMGYFGSELFRALHLTGAFNSSELIKFISEKNKDIWISNIMNSYKLKYLREDIVKNNIDEIITRLEEYKIKVFSNDYTLNQNYYIFVLEEIFRKVFGNHIFSQSDYINVRTPYLDVVFMKELFKTDLAGVNNEFFVQNPVKRLRGQYLYAKIIGKCYPELAMETTEKGYSPADLLKPSKKFNIIFPFIKKRFVRKIVKENLDNLSIISGLVYNKSNLTNVINKTNLFNNSMIYQLFDNIQNINEERRDIVAIASSIGLFVN